MPGGTLDDMNNWGDPKYMVGEVDTYKKYPDYDLYGDFNVNYVKLDRVPGFADWSAVNRALRAGEFFVSTGEVLIPANEDILDVVARQLDDFRIAKDDIISVEKFNSSSTPSGIEKASAKSNSSGTPSGIWKATERDAVPMTPEGHIIYKRKGDAMTVKEAQALLGQKVRLA